MCSFNRIFACLVVLFCLAPFTWAKYVAVLETVADPTLKDVVSQSDKTYMTDVLRSEAVKMLPAQQNYTIMTRENINAMLPPGKTIEECEGSCLAETGKNISADYVAQARIGNFGGSLTLSVELYETAGNKLVSSFNGRGADVNELLEVIKNDAPNFFKAIKGGSAFDGVGGIGDFSSGEAFSFQGNKKFIVEIVSDPIGAVPTVDGKAFSKCVSTPCKIQVEAGEHRFLVSKELYDDAETVVKVDSNNQVVSLNMDPNFGYLDIRPQVSLNLGGSDKLQIYVDSVPVNVGIVNLAPGMHFVSVTHPCYDPLSFKVSIVKDGTETFEQSLVRGVGGLELEVDKLGEPQVVPVYIDGKNVGNTPFSGEIPLCAQVTVGDSAHLENVDVELQWHKVVKYEYHLQNDSVATSDDIAHISDSIEIVNNEAVADAAQVGESIPTNVDSEGFKIHWIPVGISAAVAVTGTVLAIVGNSKAKSIHDKEPADADEYNKNIDDIYSAQNLRTAGIITAIVGAVGLGVSFAF